MPLLDGSTLGIVPLASASLRSIGPVGRPRRSGLPRRQRIAEQRNGPLVFVAVAEIGQDQLDHLQPPSFTAQR
jgi:hypothetical protein